MTQIDDRYYKAITHGCADPSPFECYKKLMILGPYYAYIGSADI